MLKDVCNEVIEKMKSIYDYFSSYDYIIATGGTYDAWATDFNAVFANMEGFSVIPANVNDPTLPTYSRTCADIISPRQSSALESEELNEY